MEYCMDVKVIYTCPCHEYCHYICRFLAIVYVIHQISKTINNYKSNLLVFTQGIINESNSKFRCVLTQAPKQKTWVILLNRKPRKLIDSLQNIMAMVFALLSIKIENLPFPLRKTCPVIEYCRICNCSCYHC